MQCKFRVEIKKSIMVINLISVHCKILLGYLFLDVFIRPNVLCTHTNAQTNDMIICHHREECVGMQTAQPRKFELYPCVSAFDRVSVKVCVCV